MHHRLNVRSNIQQPLLFKAQAMNEFDGHAVVYPGRQSPDVPGSVEETISIPRNTHRLILPPGL
jgi:hypothetical protein